MFGIGTTTHSRRTARITPTESSASPTRAVPHLAAPGRLPTHEEIARRAYEIYTASGYAPDRSEQNWQQAERELMEETLDAEV